MGGAGRGAARRGAVGAARPYLCRAGGVTRGGRGCLGGRGQPGEPGPDGAARRVGAGTRAQLGWRQVRRRRAVGRPGATGMATRRTSLLGLDRALEEQPGCPSPAVSVQPGLPNSGLGNILA